MPMPMNTISDFWKRVDKKDGCWLWRGWINSDGYGEFTMNYHTHLAHRLAYELVRGKIPAGQCVCHRCDNPACVNPEHLFVGSQADNVRDRESKGRTARGEDCSSTKLTRDDVMRIRRLCADGRSKRSLAKQFNVSRKAIRCVVKRETWAWVE